MSFQYFEKSTLSEKIEKTGRLPEFINRAGIPFRPIMQARYDVKKGEDKAQSYIRGGIMQGVQALVYFGWVCLTPEIYKVIEKLL